MTKRVILLTGTPCVGKTTTAKQLTKHLNAQYINLTQLAKNHNLTLGEDKQRHTTVIDERIMKTTLSHIIDTTQNDLIIDGHYAAAVTPKRRVTHVFILRRNPIQLRKFMEKCSFKDQKLWENLASEILDVCLVEALQEQDKEKVCELDATDKTTEEVTQDILNILENRKKCRFGGIDWLGMLEKEGKLDEYLRV